MPKQYSAASEGLVQGPYMAARIGFEHATLRTQGIEPTANNMKLLWTTEHFVL